MRLLSNIRVLLTNALFLGSKFFGKPNGSTAPAKQAKLAFSSTSSASNRNPNSSLPKENADDDGLEDAEMKNDESEPELKPKTKKEKVKPTRGIASTYK